MMLNYILVSTGAAIGGALRYGISNYIQKNISVIFPYGTLVVNIVGSFILGVIMFYLNEKELIGSELRLFLTVGFCGGFTTFSTFSYETLTLFRDSEIVLAFYNVLLNLVLCLVGIYLAYLISKFIG
ncbi:MAG: fluoride efflux transporter CrcB [Ignavibacteriales bacterium]|nr:fluoride efflux transporter CrcB [Ignavibacteriales bacterium]